MSLRSVDTTKLIGSATDSVTVLGVVPFSIDWDVVAAKWAQRLETNSRFGATVLCESENLLFAKTFTTDVSTATPRFGFKHLVMLRDEALVSLPRKLRELGVSAINMKRVRVEEMHLPIPVAVAEVDGELLSVPWLHSPESAVPHLEKGNPWSNSLREYLAVYMDQALGGKYSASKDAEVLPLYDQQRIIRGMYPRASFYDTDYAQLVVWALIFDRQGRLLIHRRDDNAKDNQGMWDKSVGGHVEFPRDDEPSRSAIREVLEELYIDEERIRKSGFRPVSISDENMVYMGEWRPYKRRHYPFLEIDSAPSDWACFRLRDTQRLYSPRLIPTDKGGGMRRLRVIADVFLFVAGESFSVDEGVGGLENSEFKLLEIGELKTVVDRAESGLPVPNFDGTSDNPTFTPDLVNIMTGEIRETLEEFSGYLKRYVSGSRSSKG